MHGIMRSSADLGLLIHAIRTRHGVTQDDLAKRLGVSQRYLSELETGKPKILNSRFFDVLRDLGIELYFRETTDE